MVGLIHKKVSAHVYSLALIGILFCPTIPSLASVADDSDAKARGLMQMIHSGHLFRLLQLSEYLHAVLKRQPALLSTGLQRISAAKKKQFEKKCDELAKEAENLRAKCAKINEKPIRQNDPEVWVITAGVLRLYEATGELLKLDFSKVEPTPTSIDSAAAAYLKRFEGMGQDYEQIQKRAAPSDVISPLLKKNLETITGQSDFKKLGDPSFSLEQQIYLHKLAEFNKNIVVDKQAIETTMKAFGLTWHQRNMRWIAETRDALGTKWATEPSFRTLVCIASAATIATGAGAVALALGKLSALTTTVIGGIGAGATTIGSYTLMGTGQRIGNYLTDGVIEVGSDLYNGVVEYTVKTGKIGSYENRVGGTRNGCVIRRIVPHDTAYEDAIIEPHEYAEELELFRDMLNAVVTMSEGERNLALADRTRTFISEGPTGAGKTFGDNFLMNICAQEARPNGVEVYEARFTAESIEHNDMEKVLYWAHEKKAIVFFNLDEVQHVKPSQKENAKAYGYLLNFFQKISESGDPYICLATTNQPEMESDLMRDLRATVKHLAYPGPDKRKKFFEHNLKKSLHCTYNEQELARFATLAEGANMAQLRVIISNLKAKKGIATSVPAYTIEREILRKMHGIAPDPSNVPQQHDEATAVHIGGQLIIATNAVDNSSIINGLVVGVASATPSIKKDPDNPKALRPVTYPGQFIWTSAIEQQNDTQELRYLVAGYVLQGYIIKEEERNDKLKKKDRNKAFELCAKQVTYGSDDFQRAPSQEIHKKAQERLEKVEKEVLEEFKRLPKELLYGTINHITRFGQMTTLDQVALRRQLAEQKNKKAGEQVPPKAAAIAAVGKK